MPPETAPETPSLWERWKIIAARAATFQARVLLTVFYYTVVPLFALAVRALSDPLGLSPDKGGRWTPIGKVDPWSQH
ncbi:MAG: hypothetical protein EB084_20960 [Proteobacteria bacterium]|nr:hypothetical protein [Pseudomonadota bacterium]